MLPKRCRLQPQRCPTCDDLALFVLGIVAVVAGLTFRDYGLGWDDYTHAEYADLLLRMYGSGFKDQAALSFANLYMYGGGFDMAAALLHKIIPLELFETRRLLGAIVGVIGLAVTWRLARRVGGPLAGLAALLLLALCPTFYGHMPVSQTSAKSALNSSLLASRNGTKFFEPTSSSPSIRMVMSIGSDPVTFFQARHASTKVINWPLSSSAPRATMILRPSACADRLYFGSQTLKIIFRAGARFKNRLRTGQYGRVGWAAGFKSRHR